MTDETTVEAILYTMIEGQVTELKYQDEIFLKKTKTVSAKPTVDITGGLPPDILCYNKNYGIYIKKEEHNKVKGVIEKFGNKATSAIIVKETGIPLHRVAAILRSMKDGHEVKPFYRKNKVFYTLPTH
jgi:uncharacterized protein (UPF0248 family)